MITIISHFNESNVTAVEDICRQNASPRGSDKEAALQSQLLPGMSDVSPCVTLGSVS